MTRSVPPTGTQRPQVFLAHRALLAQLADAFADRAQDLVRYRFVVDRAGEHDRPGESAYRENGALTRFVSASEEALDVLDVALDLPAIGRAQPLVAAPHVVAERGDRAAGSGVVSVLR